MKILRLINRFENIYEIFHVTVHANWQIIWIITNHVLYYYKTWSWITMVWTREIM